MLPNLWQIASIGDIAITVGGGTPSRQNATYFSGTIPWLTGSDLPEDTVGTVRTSRQFITQEAKQNSATTLVPPGTLLITTRVNVGKVGVAQEHVCFSQDMTGIRFHDEEVVNPEYAGFYLLVHRQSLLKLNRGTTITGITRSDLEKMKIPLPPLREQQRIVTILRQADELRRLRREAGERARALVPALFEEIWNDETIQWSDYKVGDVVARLEPGRSVAAASHPAREERWGVLKVSAVTSGTFKPEENKELPEDYIPSMDYVVRKGDLLVSRANTLEYVGASAIVEEAPLGLLLPDKIWRVVLAENKLANSLFLLQILNTPAIRKEIADRATGTSSSMKNISQERFLDIDIRLPSRERQDIFANMCRAITDQVIGEQLASVAQINKLFQSCTTQAFTGELTALWREGRVAELREAVAQRDALLRERGVHISEPTPAERVRIEVRGSAGRSLSELMDGLSAALRVDWEPPRVPLPPLVEASRGLAGRVLAQAAAQFDDTIRASVAEISRVATAQLSAALSAPLGEFVRQAYAGNVSISFEEEIAGHLREHLLRRLDVKHLLVWLAVNNAENYVTFEGLRDETGLMAGALERILDVLTMSGLIAAVSLPANPSGTTVFVPAYRAINSKRDEVRLDDLDVLNKRLNER